MLLVVTWNCAGKINENFVGQIVTECEKAAEKAHQKIEGRIICLQETSQSDNDIKKHINRLDYEGAGTGKEDSGNQRCNTAVLWEKQQFTREGRETRFYSNRYYECVKLKFNSKEFFVMSCHGPSGGPGNYASNGTKLGQIFDKEVTERFPLIIAGDMNCEPANMVLNAKKNNPGTVIPAGQPTRIKSQTELDFMIVYGGHAQVLTVACAGNVSDHCGVGFLVQAWA
jgi:exonuclease III